jgi:hypothetical protein
VCADRGARQPVAHQSVETFEALAHVGRLRRQIDPRRRTQSEHDRTGSNRLTNCSSVFASNPRPTSMRRPLASTTANPLAALRAPAWYEPASSTATRRPGSAASPCSCRRRFRYRTRVDNASSRPRQNSSRLKALDSYSATSCAAVASLPPALRSSLHFSANASS